MNFFYQTVSTVFLSLGAIIGAGFLTGKELVAFIDVNCIVPCLILAFWFFNFSFILLFSLYKNQNGLTKMNSEIFKSKNFFTLSAVAASFVSACGMTAGITSLFSQISSPLGYVSGAFFLLLSVVISSRGIGGLEKISVIIVPLIIVLTVVLIFVKGEYDFVPKRGVSAISAVKTFFYVCMNVFINLPVIADTCAGKSRKSLYLSAFIISLILTALSAMVLATVKATGTENYQMPLFISLGGNKMFLAAMFFAMFSSQISAVYPVNEFVKKRVKKGGVLISSAAVFLFSLLGFSKIVNLFYPIVGVLGAVYLIKCAFYAVKKMYKKTSLADNRTINFLCSGVKMKKKSKNKIMRLTDEQYNEYLMALKDEKPPMLVRRAQHENDKD